MRRRGFFVMETEESVYELVSWDLPGWMRRGRGKGRRKRKR
jgi:hypothetical protein